MDKALKRYFRGKLPEHDCNDLTGDVWLRVTHWYRGKGSLRVFAFIVARKLVYDTLYRRRQLTLSTSVEDVATTEAGPETFLSRVARHAVVWRVAEEVADPYRAVVKLSLAGMDNFQIAAELGLAYNTVRSRLSRGKAQLQELVKAELGGS